MIDFRDLRLADRLRELDLRQWLNDNSAITTIAAVVLLMIALGVMLMTVTGGGGNGFNPPTQKYFYDLNTRELFAVPLDELPPIDRGEPYTLPNGNTMPAGVEAIVFGPKDGTDPAEYVIGWVETLHPDRRAEIVKARNAAASANPTELAAADYLDFDSMGADRLVMDPDAESSRFVPQYSDPGMQITGRRFTDRQGEPMRPVYPR